MHQDCERILFDEGQIAKRVKELGAQIAEDHKGETIFLIGLLNGAAPFLMDLVRAIDGDVQYGFMTVSSYGNDTRSSGTLLIKQDLEAEVEGKSVIIVDDVIDTGLTLMGVRDLIAKRNPKSLKTAALLAKSAGAALMPCDYLGFSCPDEFVIGYGLDYAQRYRNLPYIGVLKPEIYS